MDGEINHVDPKFKKRIKRKSRIIEWKSEIKRYA